MTKAVCVFDDAASDGKGAQSTKQRMRKRYGLVQFRVSRVVKLRLEPGDFITIFRPWTDIQYAAIGRDGRKLCHVRVFGGVHNVLKVHNPKRSVPRFDQFPKCTV